MPSYTIERMVPGLTTDQHVGQFSPNRTPSKLANRSKKLLSDYECVRSIHLNKYDAVFRPATAITVVFEGGLVRV